MDAFIEVLVHEQNFAKGTEAKYLCLIMVMDLVRAGIHSVFLQTFGAKLYFEKMFQLESIVVSCKPAKRKLELAGTKQQVMKWY